MNSYVQGSYDKNEDFRKLDAAIRKKEVDGRANRLFYLALPPSVYESVTQKVQEECMASGSVLTPRTPSAPTVTMTTEPRSPPLPANTSITRSRTIYPPSRDSTKSTGGDKTFRPNADRSQGSVPVPTLTNTQVC